MYAERVILGSGEAQSSGGRVSSVSV
jgi:hypothetical protein